MKKVFLIISFISILTTLGFYIFQVNALTEEVYLLQNYEKKLTQLSGKSETLEVNFSKANSLVNIENYLQAQDFEKVNPGQIKYIHILESSVAAKNYTFPIIR